MSTVSNNNIVNGVTSNGQGFGQLQAKVTHASFPVNQGDLVYLNAGIAKVVSASDANAATLLGVALQPSAPTSNLDNSTAPAVKSINIGYGCRALFKTTASETYTDGTLVYSGADAQTITTVGGTHPVGVIMLPSDVASVTGAAGVSVQVLVYCRSLVAFHE